MERINCFGDIVLCKSIVRSKLHPAPSVHAPVIRWSADYVWVMSLVFLSRAFLSDVSSHGVLLNMSGPSNLSLSSLRDLYVLSRRACHSWSVF